MCLLLAITTFAQTQTPPPATPNSIVLPPRLAAGQPATLGVITLDGRVAPFAAVNLPDGKRIITDETGRARFKAPDTEGAFLVKLPDSDAMAAAAVVKAPTNSQFQMAQAPRFVSLHDYFPVYGSGFRGEAEQDHVTVGGQTALVLAASPLSLAIVPAPETPVGTGTIAIEAAGRAQADTLSVIDLSFGTATGLILPGKKVSVSVLASGTERPLAIEIRNLSPDSVQLPDHDAMLIKTHGGPENTAVFNMEGIAAGNFSLAANLASNSGMPDVVAARQFLQAAAALAAPAQRKRAIELSERIEKQPNDAAKVSEKLQKLFLKPLSGELGFWITATVNSLQGEQ